MWMSVNLVPPPHHFLPCSCNGVDVERLQSIAPKGPMGESARVEKAPPIETLYYSSVLLLLRMAVYTHMEHSETTEVLLSLLSQNKSLTGKMHFFVS